VKSALDRNELVFNGECPSCALSLTGLPGGSGRIQDRSPCGNEAGITGPFWVKIPGGLYCLRFDGIDDRVDCGDSASLRASTALTIRAWVSRDIDDADLTIASKSSFNSKRGWFLRLENDADSNRVRFYVSSDGLNNSMLDGETPVTGSSWHMVAATYQFVADGSSVMRVYLDGSPDGSREDAVGDMFAENGVNVMVGCLFDGADNPYSFFHGRIALTRICRSAWEPLMVKRVYDREKQLFGVW